MYVRSLRQLMKSWNKIKEDADKKNQIFAFLLYSTSEEKIYEYVKNYSTDICGMADTTSCKIFMIAHPPKKYRANKSYQKWVEKLNRGHDPHDHLDKKLGIATGYNPSFEVANKLGVKPKEFPCITFFKDLNNPKAIVFNLPTYRFEEDRANENELIGRGIAGVFSAIQFSADDEEKFPPEKQREERWRRLEKYVKAEKRKKGIKRVRTVAISLYDIVLPIITLIPRFTS
jgi:hypothetical protein